MIKIIIASLTVFIFGCGNPYPENKKDAITKGIDTVRTDGSIVPIKERDETPIFHVKIKSYGDGVCYFAIWFTNDNFITQQNIMQVIDLSEISGGVDVHFQLDLFRTSDEAIQFAKQFKTYDLCVAYNEKMRLSYEKTLQMRKANPPPKKEYYRENGSECKQPIDILVK